MALAAPERSPHAIGDDAAAASVEEAFEALNAAAPEGWRVELIEGSIRVVPPANGEHEEIVAEVADRVTGRRKDATLRTRTGLGLKVPGASVTGMVVPDPVIAPRAASATPWSTTARRR
ncbi:hypothetical protein [Streptomyces sp. NPDC018045]|uniref:hypothetical protein n=1 Tax=Streptomyces sp. NPDC018045 TaxID=3365037 RepID=UPI0037A984B5